jgi:hypothetical protein
MPFAERTALLEQEAREREEHVIRLVTAMLIFASHRLRNRIMRTPEAAMAMMMLAAAFTVLQPSRNLLKSVIFPSLEVSIAYRPAWDDAVAPSLRHADLAQVLLRCSWIRNCAS